MGMGHAVSMQLTLRKIGCLDILLNSIGTNTATAGQGDVSIEFPQTFQQDF